MSDQVCLIFNEMFDPQNMGVDTRIMQLSILLTELLLITDFSIMADKFA